MHVWQEPPITDRPDYRHFQAEISEQVIVHIRAVHQLSRSSRTPAAELPAFRAELQRDGDEVIYSQVAGESDRVPWRAELLSVSQETIAYDVEADWG